MAGAGFHDFTAGNVLTANQLDTYLMHQSVMVFADAAARNTALSGVLAEGMRAFLLDTNCLTVYSGSAWSTIGPEHGALTSWTPTVTQSGSVSITINYAKCQRHGRLIRGWMRVTCTGSGTGGQPIIIGGLPATAAASGLLVGGARVFDSSATTTHIADCIMESTTTFSMGGSGAIADARLGVTVFAAGLATNDVISLEFGYEAASDA